MWSPGQLTRTQSNHSVALSIASMTSSASSQNSLSSFQGASATPDTHFSEHDMHEQHPDYEREREVVLNDSLREKQGFSQSPAPQGLRTKELSQQFEQIRQQQQQRQPPPPPIQQPAAFNLDEVMPDMWDLKKKKSLTLNSKEHFLVAAKSHRDLHQTLEMQRRLSESVASEDSHATLADEQSDGDDAHDMDMDLKTPTVPRMSASIDSPIDFQAAGPMSKLLHSLLQRVANVERAQPTIMAEDHTSLQDRIVELERENSSMLRSYNDLLALRNDDLMNLIKIRGLLADERHEHAAMRRLRDEDLENVLILREKLAKDTWSGKLQNSTPSASPQMERRNTVNNRNSRPVSDDLWQQAKTAAMEQRVLELEKANAELRAAAVATPATVPTAGHPMAPIFSGGGELMTRVETMFEDSLRQREKMASKVQQLRSEKEQLQKEVHTLEDRNGELEVLVERLKRSVNVSVKSMT
jgi:hypothetical protein